MSRREALRAGLRLARRYNLEVITGVFPPLSFAVAFDCLLVHRAYARTGILPRPQVLAAVTLLQLGKFRLQHPARFPLYVLPSVPALTAAAHSAAMFTRSALTAPCSITT